MSQTKKVIQFNLFLSIFYSITFQCTYPTSLIEHFQQNGYVEICDTQNGSSTFNLLYQSFDEFIEFLQKNKFWQHKLYHAKERFIRSKYKNIYSTDFFGFYDESNTKSRTQISFYYASHFQEFLYNHYPEFTQIPEINNFFTICFQIQQSYESLFYQTATELELNNLCSSWNNHPPILFKVIKYLPSYFATQPHYDGTAFSLFLDSTDSESLLMSAYKNIFTIDDFHTPIKTFSRNENQNSILLIPGSQLTEFGIYPTPHIVIHSGKVRYATIAFAMRPNYLGQKNNFTSLPNFY